MNSFMKQKLFLYLLLLTPVSLVGHLRPVNPNKQVNKERKKKDELSKRKGEKKKMKKERKGGKKGGGGGGEKNRQVRCTKPGQ